MTEAKDFILRYTEIRSLDYLIDYTVGELDRLGRLQNCADEKMATASAKEYQEWGERRNFLEEQKRLKV